MSYDIELYGNGLDLAVEVEDQRQAETFFAEAYLSNKWDEGWLHEGYGPLRTPRCLQSFTSWKNQGD